MHINHKVLRLPCPVKWHLHFLLLMWVRPSTLNYAAGMAQWSLVGKNVTLNCEVSVDAMVDWSYQSNSSDEVQILFANSKYMQPGMRAERLDGKSYILMIYNVSQKHSGLYSCKEDGGFGITHHIQLFVEETLSSIDAVSERPAVSVDHSDNNRIPQYTDENTVQHSDWNIYGVAVITTLMSIAAIAVAIFTAWTRIYIRKLRKSARAKKMLDEYINDSRPLPALASEVHLCFNGGPTDKKNSEITYPLDVSSQGTIIIPGEKSLSLLSKHNVCPRCYTPAFAATLCMYCVTVLEKFVYVICKDSPDTLKVFHLYGQHFKNIPVKWLKEPCDIVACSKKNVLYVADNDCIWQVSLDGEMIKFQNACRPLTLSVTSGRLTVTTCDTLLLYGDDGVELKRLPLTNMSPLQHAVETECGKFIVCHLRPQPQVSEIDGSGKITHAFSDPRKLGMPSFMSPGDDGKVFVVDADKRRVLLLGSNLECIGVLLEFPRNELIKRPCRMCYVEHTRQLIVAGGSLFGCIQVFSVYEPSVQQF